MKVDRREKTKRFKLVAFMMVLMLISTKNTHAIFIDGIGYAGSNVEVAGAGEYTTLTLTGDTEQDLIIRSKEKVILDLNGHTLKNYTPEEEAIKVLKGGELMIVDSVGTGVVTQREDSTCSVITNEGMLGIDSGTFTTTRDFYVVRNEGSMAILGGTFASTSTKTSLIGNLGKEEDDVLAIEGGTFHAVVDVIINYADAKLSITKGELTSDKFYVVDNWGLAVISGGTLTSKENAALHLGMEASTSEESVGLAIQGGKIVSPAGVSVIKLTDHNSADLTEGIEISGGTFSSDVSDYLAKDITLEKDSHGNFTIVQKQEESKPEARSDQNVKENPNTYDSFGTSLIFMIFGCFIFGYASKKVWSK